MDKITHPYHDFRWYKILTNIICVHVNIYQLYIILKYKLQWIPISHYAINAQHNRPSIFYVVCKNFSCAPCTQMWTRVTSQQLRTIAINSKWWYANLFYIIIFSVRIRNFEIGMAVFILPYHVWYLKYDFYSYLCKDRCRIGSVWSIRLSQGYLFHRCRHMI